MNNNIKDNLNNLHFGSEAEYANFLGQLMAKLAEKGEFNIMVHQVGPHRTFMYNNKKEKIEGIKKYGLSVSPYPTLAGTTWFMGNARTINVDKVVHYHFMDDSAINHTFIFALPKYITVDGKQVEYSSFEGEGSNLLSTSLPNKLNAAFKEKINFVPLAPQTKVCLCDVLNYYSIPNCFCLGLQIAGQDEYEFQLNTKHFAFASAAEKAEVMQKLEADTKQAYERYNTTDLVEMIVESYLEHERTKDCSSDDFD